MRKLHGERIPAAVSAVRGCGERLQRLLDSLMPPDMLMPGLSPAFAGGPCGAPVRMPIQEPLCGSTVLRFDTGDAPSRGTAARRIMEWEKIDVILPGEGTKGGKNAITHEQAQAEVSRLMKSTASTHQYLAYEAAKLCGGSPLVARYTLHIVAGAAAEDLVFAPGEKLGDISHGDSSLLQSRAKLSEAVAPQEEPGFLGKVFGGLAGAWKWLSGGGENDSVNRPYFAHFYDPGRKGAKGLDLLDGQLHFQSAAERIKMYWNAASGFYLANDRPRAFCALGHLVHLVQDLHVPAHVHNDVHGPTVILGKKDSLEDWAARADFQSIARRKSEPNVRIWNSKPLAPPKADRSWDRGNLEEKLSRFALEIARETQAFRSVDAPGTLSSQKATGKLSDGMCYAQAGVLIPKAIMHSAWIINQFLDYHRRVYGVSC